jgi:hypothetical protein
MVSLGAEGILMGAAASRGRRPWIWTCLILLLVLVGGAGALAWFVWNQLGSRPDGTRVSLVFSGGTRSTMVKGFQPVHLADELMKEGLQIMGGGTQAEIEEQFFLRRERHVLNIFLTAGKQTLETGRLGYVLLDKGGTELSQGLLQPEIVIAAGRTETVQIIDASLADTVRIELRRLP